MRSMKICASAFLLQERENMHYLKNSNMKEQKSKPVTLFRYTRVLKKRGTKDAAVWLNQDQ